MTSPLSQRNGTRITPPQSRTDATPPIESPASTPCATPPATGTILAIDDSRTSLSVLGQRLGQLDYRTALSDNGSEGLDLIAARGFDLVLLDMVMPGMSGLQVLHEIRSNADTADLPVIMMTGHRDPAAAIDGLAAGADDHVAKPLDFDVLAARIARVLARARRITELKRANAALDARCPRCDACGRTGRNQGHARRDAGRAQAPGCVGQGADRPDPMAQPNQRFALKYPMIPIVIAMQIPPIASNAQGSLA